MNQRMRNKSALILVIFVLFFIYFISRPSHNKYKIRVDPCQECQLINPLQFTKFETQLIENTGEKKTIKESDITLLEVSLILQSTSQRLGQLSCRTSENGVSVNGGWCAEESSAHSIEHRTDESLINFFITFLKGKRVASFGDGPGLYKKEINAKSSDIVYDAYDGAPFTETVTESRCKFLDLSVPIHHLKPYDWVVSLEVAEHIPKSSESFYLDNLARYAKEGIILSWAKPGQDGYSHVNEQPFEYVKERLLNRGFIHDVEKSIQIKEASTYSWLKNNLNVFRKQ